MVACDRLSVPGASPQVARFLLTGPRPCLRTLAATAGMLFVYPHDAHYRQGANAIWGDSRPTGPARSLCVALAPVNPMKGGGASVIMRSARLLLTRRATMASVVVAATSQRSIPVPEGGKVMSGSAQAHSPRSRATPSLPAGFKVLDIDEQLCRATTAPHRSPQTGRRGRVELPCKRRAALLAA